MALSKLAETVIDDVIDFACRLAKHRGSNSLHRNDIRLAFEKRLKVRIPLKTQVPNQQNSAANANHQSGMAATASANLPVSLPTPTVSTANYKSNLVAVKKA